MAMRYSFLFGHFGVSRILLTRQTYNVCHKQNATTAIFPVSLKKKEISKKSPIEQDDPDVFGTLSSRVNLGSHKFDSMTNHELSDDEGDVQEEKYLSFQPADRKNVEEFELEIKQLIAAFEQFNKWADLTLRLFHLNSSTRARTLRRQ